MAKVLELTGNLVDDIHDTVLMILPAWPFTGGPGEKRDMKIVSLMCIHHSFGIVSLVPVVLTGLYKDARVQAIGWALLLAGGVSCTILAYNRTINRNTPTARGRPLWSGRSMFHSTTTAGSGCTPESYMI